MKTRDSVEYLLHCCCARIFAWIQSTILFVLGVTQRAERAGRPVQISRILRRRSVYFDTFSWDFLSLHHTFTTLNYLRKDEVSLYTVDTKYAYFVEVEKGMNVYSSDVHPFLYKAQFFNAKMLMKVSIKAFLDLANSIEMEVPVIFLFNTGRCGSTLLLQMFEQTGQFLTLSEPNALFKTTEFTQLLGEDIVRAIVKVDIKSKILSPRAYVIKPKGEVFAVASLINKACPFVTNIFLYRSAIDTINSLLKVELSEQKVSSLHQLNHTKCFFKPQKLKTLLIGDLNQKFQSHAVFCTWYYASYIRRYLNLVEDGMPFLAIRYEDLVANPDDLFGKCITLLGYSPYQVPIQDTSRALSRDSQRGATISRHAMRHLGNSVMEKEYSKPSVKILCDIECDKLNVPRLDSGVLLPQTIQCDF